MKKCPFCSEEIQDEAIICKHCGKELDKKKVKQKEYKWTPLKIGCVVIFIFLVVPTIYLTVSSNNSSGSNKTEKSPAYMLASLQVGHPNPSQNMIAEFDGRLDSLIRKCKENDKLKISDYVVTSQQLLAKEGKNLQLSEIIDGIDKSIPDEAEDFISCAEVASMFVVMVTTE